VQKKNVYTVRVHIY